MFLIEPKYILWLLFNLGDKTVPCDYIVLIFIVEYHFSVHEVFNDLLATAILQEVGPLS